MSDRSGGLVCSYLSSDYSGPYVFECRVVRIANDQSRPWGDNCGITVNAPENSSIVISTPVLPDNVVRVTWLASLLDVATLQTQRLNLNTGVPQYATPVELATGYQNSSTNVNIVKLSGGSTAVAWETEWSHRHIVWFQILDAFGTPMFGGPGRPLALDSVGAPAVGFYSTLASDGPGRVLRGIQQFSERFLPDSYGAY
ncbi:MAG: hypothetical protein IPP40_12015 [bacterium]|nr:hypothetical protein [bacterium]